MFLLNPIPRLYKLSTVMPQLYTPVYRQFIATLSWFLPMIQHMGVCVCAYVYVCKFIHYSCGVQSLLWR